MVGSQSNLNKTLQQIIAIFFIQATSTVSYAVFYSGLSIFLTQNKNYTHEASGIITGLFLSLNYLLPIIGGYLANRLISYKHLFYLGYTASILGCLLLINGIFLHLSLSLFLMGSLSNVCLSMFITELFTNEQNKQRRIAFIWNYLGMNLGFLIGYLLTGFSTLFNTYQYLFALMSLLQFFSIGMVYLFIHEYHFQSAIKKDYFKKLILCLLAIAFLISIIKILFDYAEHIHEFLIILSIAILILMLYYSFKKANFDEKKKIILFSYYSVAAIIFWSFYLLTPVAIIQFIHKNVQNNIFGIYFAPQWFANINSIVILIIAPVIAFLIKRSKDNGILTSTSNYFSIGYLFSCIAFLMLFVGLSFCLVNGKMPAFIIFIYLISLTIGETLIYPVSNALIGELIKEPMRGIMTGTLNLNIAIGGLLAGMISSRFILPYLNSNNVITPTSPSLSNVFLAISLILLTSGIIISLMTFKWDKMYSLNNKEKQEENKMNIVNLLTTLSNNIVDKNSLDNILANQPDEIRQAIISNDVKKIKNLISQKEFYANEVKVTIY